MSLEDFLAVVRDVLVVAYMFVLRIGVPILITLMIGAWLKRLVEEKDKPEQVTAPASSELHCWDIKKCSEAEQAKCIARQRPDLPCWLALQVDGEGLKEMCYTCPVYTVRADAVSARA